MKRQIRYGIFESNSSSSHCILITKKDKLLTKEDFWHEGDPYNENKKYFPMWNKGVWTAGHDKEDLYFGWGFKILSTLEDKIKYALASLCGEYSGHTDEQKVDYYNEILEAVKNVIPELEEIKLPKEEIIIYKDLEGNELNENEIYIDWSVSEESAMYHFYKKDGLKHPAIPAGDCYIIPAIGGIDHQSAGLLKDFLKKKNITIANFLLNEKYIVVVDNDNNFYLDEFLHNGLIDLNNIDEMYSWEEDYASFMEYSNSDKEEEEDA